MTQVVRSPLNGWMESLGNLTVPWLDPPDPAGAAAREGADEVGGGVERPSILTKIE